MFVKKLVRLLGVSVLALAVFGGVFAVASAEEKSNRVNRVVKVEMAENPTTFFFSKPVGVDETPEYGAEYTTGGYLYPEGTLKGASGVLPGGEPRFADKVIGEWTCKGLYGQTFKVGADLQCEFKYYE